MHDRRRRRQDLDPRDPLLLLEDVGADEVLVVEQALGRDGEALGRKARQERFLAPVDLQIGLEDEVEVGERPPFRQVRRSGRARGIARRSPALDPAQEGRALALRQAALVRELAVEVRRDVPGRHDPLAHDEADHLRSTERVVVGDELEGCHLSRPVARHAVLLEDRRHVLVVGHRLGQRLELLRREPREDAPRRVGGRDGGSLASQHGLERVLEVVVLALRAHGPDVELVVDRAAVAQAPLGVEHEHLGRGAHVEGAQELLALVAEDRELEPEARGLSPDLDGPDQRALVDADETDPAPAEALVQPGERRAVALGDRAADLREGDHQHALVTASKRVVGLARQGRQRHVGHGAAEEIDRRMGIGRERQRHARVAGRAGESLASGSSLAPSAQAASSSARTAQCEGSGNGRAAWHR